MGMSWASVLRREFAAIKLSILVSLALISPVIFLSYWHSGHHHAWVGSNPHCTDHARAPPGTREPWGDLHGTPLVIAQITDLHIGEVDGYAAKSNYMLFLNNVLPHLARTIDAVLVSGDIVSAKKYPRTMQTLLGYYSEQDMAEWLWYNHTTSIATTALPSGVRWLTVPGNHDAFGSSDKTLYRKYGISDRDQAKAFRAGSRVYSVNIREHQIIALDATLNPSPHRPLNFFGRIDADIADQLERELSTHHGSLMSTILLSHYPTSVLKNGRRVADLLSRRLSENTVRSPTAIFISGHLHTLRGLSPGGLQAVSKSSHLELQLPDMLQTARFRLIVVDHGLPAWNDFQVSSPSEDAYIIVTNPPRAGLCGPGAGIAAQQSTHVRFFAVASHSGSARLPAMSLFIDGEFLGFAQKAPDMDENSSGRPQRGGIYVVPWNSSKYWNDGNVHTLQIYDDEAGELLLYHKFALDGRQFDHFSEAWHAHVSAYFALSHFDSLARDIVCYGILASVACLGVCWITDAAGRLLYAALIALMLSFLFNGPFLIVPGLTEAGGIGLVTLGEIRVAEGVLVDSVDPYFGLIPVLYSCVVLFCASNSLVVCGKHFSNSSVVFLMRIFAVFRGFVWTCKILGAHGISAAVISPSCMPMLALCSLICYHLRPAPRLGCKAKSKHG